MSESPTILLLDLLAERAASDGEEPWLFFRHELHWRWLSWGQLADQVARAAERLADVAVRPAAPLAFASHPPAAAEAVDLALTAAGLAGRVLPGEAAEAHRQAEQEGFAGWVEVVEEDAAPIVGPSDLATVALPAPRSRLRHWQARPLEAGGRDADAVAELTELAAWGQRVPASEQRIIAHCGVGLDQPAGRALVAWSLLSGAAIALPSRPGELLPDLLWTRPHLVLAPTAELDLLAIALEERRRTRHRRLLAVASSDRDTTGEAERWARLGVVCLPPPPDLSAGTSPPTPSTPHRGATSG